MAVFSLQEVKKLQVQNVNDGNFASWSEDSIYGYYGGGFAPGLTPANTALIDRIDFSSETTSVRSILLLSVGNLPPP